MTGYIAMLTVTFTFGTPAVFHTDKLFQDFELCMAAVQRMAIDHNIEFWKNPVLNHNDLPIYTANCKEI